MTERDENEQLEKDMAYTPGSESETQERQESPASSRATDDPEIDEGDVNLLPGTGGPDDVGDIEVDPEDLNLPGRRQNPTE